MGDPIYPKKFSQKKIIPKTFDVWDLPVNCKSMWAQRGFIDTHGIPSFWWLPPIEAYIIYIYIYTLL